MKGNSVYDIITERVIALLEAGTIVWQKSWQAGEHAPQNLISRKPYRGINLFLLSSLHYESEYFLTYAQAREMGGHVKRGEKSCPVVFWKWLDAEDQTTGEKKRIPLLRYYSVFNVAQCESVPVPVVIKHVREHAPIEAAQSIIDSMPKRPEIKHGLNQAFYSPTADFVGMPMAGQFKTAEDYYSTLFHELIHSTGHESRLNRKGITGSGGQWSSFGSNSYSKEELVAEMGANFLCAEAGILERTVNNSASYIAAWLKRLKDDSKLVVQAASQSQRASDFILNRLPAEQTELALAA